MSSNRLKNARYAKGMSAKSLSAKLGGKVSAREISRCELDGSVLDGEKMSLLANALDVPLAYLLDYGEFSVYQKNFRKKSSFGKRAEARVDIDATVALQKYVDVESMLGIASGDWNKPDMDLCLGLNSPQDAEEVAVELRRHWRLGSDPIRSMSAAIEREGVKLIALHLPDNIDGVSARARPPDVEAIIINADKPGERQRFTIAHELGHQFLCIGDCVDEKLCNWFAGAFLMPKDMALYEIGERRARIDFPELFALKDLFGMSAQAIAYRCRDLGIISQSVFRSLMKQVNARGWRKSEPNPLPPESPERFKRLCWRALDEGLITESRAAELLDMSVRRLHQETVESE